MRCQVRIFGSLALLGLLPSTALAYEEQATLGLGIGYASMLGSDTLPSNGVDLALSAGAGIGEAWSIGGLVAYSVFADEQPLHLGMAGLETVYALDIVRFVPLLGFGVDGLLSVRDRRSRGDFALHVLLGFDYLINPRWLVGADVRGFWVATNAHSPLDPFFLTAALRVGLRFDLR